MESAIRLYGSKILLGEIRKLYYSRNSWNSYGDGSTCWSWKVCRLTGTLVEGLKEVSQSMNVVADKLIQVVREMSGQPSTT